VVKKSGDENKREIKPRSVKIKSHHVGEKCVKELSKGSLTIEQNSSKGRVKLRFKGYTNRQKTKGVHRHGLECTTTQKK